MPTVEDFQSEGFINALEKQENDISLPVLVEDASFILNRLGKNEFLKEQK